MGRYVGIVVQGSQNQFQGSGHSQDSHADMVFII